MDVLQPFGRDYKGSEIIGYSVKCPGCKMRHGIYITPTEYNYPVWSFDGNLEKPTFAPSLLVTWDHGEEHEARRCHSFIRNGVWEFLTDCTHELAGQKVPMIEI